ncbi:FKBP-type peptidyl-prolyl cis-trans isomerase [Parabacteroides pacaensis]|uniref:FKBP-type peptidyl-prolyl cis-trans isomerase n=1 Tax=Parabacteroides pacaensis TaxID=2086575 RepID=UPI000D0F7CAF|nr:FKBP-type peptidyl-prolyl cis-trans isomerase [Parabacteroides pacaensis]
MKKMNVLAATAIVVFSVAVSSCDSKKTARLTNDFDSASYAMGVANGAGFKQSLRNIPGDTIDVELLLAGFEQGMRNDTAAMKMTPQQAGEYVQRYFTEVQTKVNKKTKEEGDKFLAENKTKDGVITTESGLQYKVITEGTGPKPTATDKVKVHYKGTLLNGDKFDSSYDRNEPAVFGLDEVVRGWGEILQIMPVGSKYIVWIPSDLAYGERPPYGSNLKPNSMLIFEMELLDIVKDDAKAPGKK